MADTAAAAAPPLVPVPPDRTPALLPTPPSSCRLLPPPPSPAPSASKKQGRASTSESWIRDKAARSALAPPKPIVMREVGRVPGRASLSDSWVADKLLTSVAPALSRGSWNGGCSKRSLAPPADKCGKKPRTKWCV